MGSEKVTQILVAGAKVGVVGLEEILAEAQELKAATDEELGEFLLERAKKRNYMPEAAKENYKSALLRELKKRLGEPVEEEGPAGWEIKVLGPGCARCEELFNTAMSAVAHLGIPASVDYVKDLREIASYGVVQVPAVVVNDRVILAGRVPGLEELKEKFSELL